MNRRHRFRFATGLLAAILGFGACGTTAPVFRGLPYPDPALADDFALTDQHGEEFRLHEHRGKIVLMFFGFVHCPDVCPTTLSTWARVQQELGDAADRVEFVFVTVDPDRDTAELLARHLAVFSDDFIGLTGTLEQLVPVYDSFKIFREKMRFGSSANAYIMDHSSRALLIDAQGRLRLSYGFESSSDNVVHDVRLLLGE